MLEITHAINTHCVSVCNTELMDTEGCFPRFVTADEPRSGLFSLKIISCYGVFLEKYWRIVSTT